MHRRDHSDLDRFAQCRRCHRPRHAAKELEVDTVLIGASLCSAFYYMLRGHGLKGLTKKLPRDCRLMIGS